MSLKIEQTKGRKKEAKRKKREEKKRSIHIKKLNKINENVKKLKKHMKTFPCLHGNEAAKITFAMYLMSFAR